MAHEKGNERIVAIVSAFNEERDIGGVLRELTSYPGFEEVIVVDDGSTDATAQIASSFPVRLIRHAINRGKGQAMQTGVDANNAEIIFFCDADMRGLSHALLDDILNPVVMRETDMVIAMRNWRMYYAEFILSIIPILGGQRALRRTLWEKVPHQYKERFMVETALNFYARYWGDGYQYKVVPGLTQTIKEKKYGIWRGFLARLRMSTEVMMTQIRLHYAAVPTDVRTGQIALVNVAWAFVGMSVGMLLVLAAYNGPVAFVNDLYAAELREDANTPFINLLFFLAANASAEILAGFGVALLLIHGLVAALNLKNVRYMLYPLSTVQRI